MSKTPKLTYEELLELADQLPEEPMDVYNEGLNHEEPQDGVWYTTDPARSNTVLIRVATWDKDKKEALPEAQRLFAIRGVQPYSYFRTASYHCWRCIPVKK